MLRLSFQIFVYVTYGRYLCLIKQEVITIRYTIMTTRTDNRELVLDVLDYESIANMMDGDKGYIEYEDGDCLVAFDYEIEVDGYEIPGSYFYPPEYVTTRVDVTVKNAFAYEGEEERIPVIDEIALSRELESQIR